MEILYTVLLVFFCVPGSLILVAIITWKALRRLLGVLKPEVLVLRDVQGKIVYDWHKQARDRFPVRYAVFERLPAYIRGLWERAKRHFRRRQVREVILTQAFDTFVAWVDANWDIIGRDLSTDLGEEGPVARYNTRMAEIRALYDWWTVDRPAYVRKIDEMDPDVREFSLIDAELDDEHNFARLANVWRDIT